MRKMMSKLVQTFLIGLFAYYVITRTITVLAVLVCLASTGIVALGYLIMYVVNRKR